MTGSGMHEDEARRRFAAPVARLATVSAEGRPHLVPIVFALAGDTLYHGVDAKPKRTADLRRLANIDAHPEVAVLVDHYEDDWSALWWVRADGTARTVDPAGPEGAEAIGRLSGRYPAFRLTGRLLAVEITRWSYWSAGQLPD
jgi:PPOX class probable F420-dependent enzyme